METQRDLVTEDDTLYTLEKFINLCDMGNFIDYDGFGMYSDGVIIYEKTIYPSDAVNGNVDYGFSHVAWYIR